MKKLLFGIIMSTILLLPACTNSDEPTEEEVTLSQYKDRIEELKIENGELKLENAKLEKQITAMEREQQRRDSKE